MEFSFVLTLTAQNKYSGSTKKKKSSEPTA